MPVTTRPRPLHTPGSATHVSGQLRASERLVQPRSTGEGWGLWEGQQRAQSPTVRGRRWDSDLLQSEETAQTKPGAPSGRKLTKPRSESARKQPPGPWGDSAASQKPPAGLGTRARCLHVSTPSLAPDVRRLSGHLPSSWECEGG